MKKITLFLLILLGAVWQPVQAQGFSMEDCHIDIYIRAEGYFDVVENYDVIFNTPKHGLFRDLETQFNFQDENANITRRKIYLTDIDVTDHPFSVTGDGPFGGNKVSIKIGDKNITVLGPQHYQIRYRVKNALLFTDSLVQLYWNVKPSEWMALFNKITFSVHAPNGSQLSPESCFVYAGQQGVSIPSTEFDYQYRENTFTATAHSNFLSVPGQSITVLVKLPRHLVTEADFSPSFWQRHKILLTLAGFLLLLIAWAIHRVRSSRITPVTAYYPPEDMDPAMAGVLIDNLTQSRDISCLLPYWATKGIIKMEAIEKGERSIAGDLKLRLLKPLPVSSAGYQYNLFQKVFWGGVRSEVLTSSLVGVFTEPMQLLSKASKDYYAQKSNTGLWVVMILSWLWAFFSITLFPFLLQQYIDIETGAFIAFLIFNFIFFFLIFPFGVGYISKRYRKKTKEGRQLTAELLGFRTFIKEAELERIKILLREDPDYFEKTMPYAMAFNLLKEWTDKFEGLAVHAPQWYSSSSHTRFTLNQFQHSFHQSMRAASLSMVISPSSRSSSSHSSGGGFSGGGAGGGGGGSW